jgi:hypothetical protein
LKPRLNESDFHFQKDYRTNLLPVKAARTAKLHDELFGITRQAIEAYVRGDKAVFDRLLGASFPSRALYISRLRPQTDVASFEVKDLKIQIMDYYSELYRADVIAHYKSLMNDKERNYHNGILYKRTNGTWQVVEWHSVRAAG